MERTAGGGLHRASSPRATAIAWALVAAQFGLLVVLLMSSPAPDWSIPSWLDQAARWLGWFGLAWLVAGAVNLGRSLTALPLPVRHGVLRTRGLYRLSRHPIYTGVLALAFSAAIRTAALGPLLLAFALFAVLAVKARFEEGELVDAYPDYAAYRDRTPRFLPIGRRLSRPR